MTYLSRLMPAALILCFLGALILTYGTPWTFPRVFAHAAPILGLLAWLVYELVTAPIGPDDEGW